MASWPHCYLPAMLQNPSSAQYCLLQGASQALALVLLCLVLRSTMAARVDLQTGPGGTLMTGKSFTIENNQFMKDGKPFRIISGSIHYNRYASPRPARRFLVCPPFCSSDVPSNAEMVIKTLAPFAIGRSTSGEKAQLPIDVVAHNVRCMIVQDSCGVLA